MKPAQAQERDDAQQRVTHPLQRLRGYIRSYVSAEGLATLVLYLALWFWIGLVVDYGFFKVFGVDWVQELPWGFRALLLGGLVAGLLALVITKMLVRLLREFRDPALALLLERRFPAELGDRLITAVEMADPRLAERHGFSRAMIEQTIREAANCVGRLPVEDVFNWRRLRRAGIWVGALTLGLYLLVAAGYCAITFAGVGDFVVRFNNVAGLWFERNILLRNAIWPRRAHLELVHFPASGDLRVGRNAPPPALRVRALRWVVADAGAPEGWRAMKWGDVHPDLSGMETSSDLLPNPWHDWTLDQIEQQLDKPETQSALSADTVITLRSLFAQLEERVAWPSMARRFRKLEIPAVVVVYYKGETVRNEQTLKKQTDNEYSGVLSDLKESVRFTANGEDYYTPYKTITVVPPPSLIELFADEEQPAYLHHRPPAGGEPKDLRGKKQHFTNRPMSLSGNASHIDVPSGTGVILRGKTDKRLLVPDGVRLRPREGAAPIKVLPRQIDEHSFEVRFDNVTAAIDFEFEFTDTDEVIGRRHVTIKPLDDLPPDVDVMVEVIRKTNQGYLATASAKIPFSGKVRDDHGLNDVQYAFILSSLDAQAIEATKPVVSILQYSPIRGPAGLSAPGYLAWVGALTRSIADETNRPPVTAPVPTFARRLRESAADDAPAADFEKRLHERPEQKLLRDHTFDPEDEFFDVEKLRLKVTDDQQAQPRYRLRLWVVATDNNVETGPGISDSREKFTILIVSENELLMEIAKVEEGLQLKLEDTIAKLKDGRNKLDLVMQELPSLQPQEFSPMARRTEEIIDALVKGWDVTREIYIDYRNILKELQVNRINPKIVEKVERNICEPLDGVINQEFVRSDESLRAFHKTLEEKHADAPAAKLAREQMDALIDRLLRVHDAMGDMTTINKLIQQLMDIYDKEVKAGRRFKELKDQIEDQLLDQQLFTPKPEEKK